MISVPHCVKYARILEFSDLYSGIFYVMSDAAMLKNY